MLSPLGFLMVGYSLLGRWQRALAAGVFLLVECAVFVGLNTLPSTSEPQSAVQWYGAVYGQRLLPPLIVLTVTLGLIYVPPRPDQGHCKKCGYDLRGLQSCRCPECGTPFEGDDQQSC